MARAAPLAPKHRRYESGVDPFVNAFDLFADITMSVESGQSPNKNSDDGYDHGSVKQQTKHNDAFSREKLCYKYKFIREIGYGRYVY